MNTVANGIKCWIKFVLLKDSLHSYNYL